MLHQQMRTLTILAAAGAILLAACAGEKRDRSDGATAAARATTLDTMQVPADLRHLAPLAEEWGIGDDVDRGAKVDASSAAERDALRTALAPHHARITAWLDSFAQGTPMPDEAAAFMYMQLALEEMPR